MSLPTGLFNQTITIYGKSSYNAQGREIVGSGVAVQARFQAKQKNVMSPTGAIITIAAIAYVASDTSVNIDDKVTYDGQTYKVYAKNKATDGQGNVNHIRLDLLKWQT